MCLLCGPSARAVNGDVSPAQATPAKPGTATEPIRYLGQTKPDLAFHDGRVPPVVGVHNIQVVRANRTHPNADSADGFGWTYNHAPMLAYWNGRFYLEYLSNPVGEHVPPGQTLLVESTNGYHWSKPRVVFPPFKATATNAETVSHQRTGFFISPDGRLLVLGFYGLPPDVNNGKGIGRVVREVRRDDSLGPVYFLRYNRHAGWNETNTPFPFYKTSTNAGFVAACETLLTNKLVTQQWWEEDRANDGFFALAGEDRGFDAKALSYYHRPDGVVVGLWKKRWAALSFDEGQSWTAPARLPSIVTGGAKIWGQRTDDGRYAVVFNPDPASRWPLVVLNGPDGVRFDDMLLVHGEIPYVRYDGRFKSFGPQYVRGIAEGNGNPPGDDLWLTYSMNKEDIWVARVPLPIHGTVTEPVRDNFDDQSPGPTVRDWNIYSPLWCPVALVRAPDGQAGQCLELRDADKYDYAKAVRVFPAVTNATIRFRLRPQQFGPEPFEIEVLDRSGARPIRLSVSPSGALESKSPGSTGHPASLTTLKAGQWSAIELRLVTNRQRYDLLVDGKEIATALPFAELTPGPMERLCFRTGTFRDYDARVADRILDDELLGDRLDGDVKSPLADFFVDDVEVR